MNILGGLNWLDVLLLALTLVSLGIGYWQGLLRQIIGLLALYIGTILGAQYYTTVSSWIRALLFQIEPNKFLNAFSFFIILGVVTLLINWLAYDAYRSTRLTLVPIFDHLAGAVLGLITLVMVVTLALPIIDFATSEPWPPSESTRYIIIDGLQTSRFLPIFGMLKPWLLNTIGPWLPAGLPSIFNL